MKNDLWNKHELARSACLAPGTPVLMFDGSVKKVEDIAVEDLLMGPDSKPRTVTSLAHGEEEMFRVNQTYGSSYTVNARHTLCFKVSGAQPGQCFTLPDQRIVRQGDFLNLTVEEYRKLPTELRKVIGGYSAAVSFPAKKDTMDYRKLGSYAAEIENVKESRKYTDAELKDMHYRGYCAHFEFYKRFEKNLELDDFQFINDFCKLPHKYLIASEENRMRLLAGFMDYMDTSYFERSHGQDSRYFRIKTEPGYDCGAMDQMAFVAQSLGFKTQREEMKNGRVHTLRIYGHLRKLAEYSYDSGYLLDTLEVEDTTEQKLHNHLAVKSIGVGEYYGFTLKEDDRRFLLGDCTVTR